jgi:hypothetical protein
LSTQGWIKREVNFTHAAYAQDRADLVPTKLRVG